jgi:23S rRNA (pseudouridine1915-N3)-methyltransferase
VPADARVVALDERGRNLSSTEFASRLERWRDEGVRDIAFLVGGADGLAQSVRDRADFVLALGTLTWPHELVRVLVAEQIYRAWTIVQGHPYHRG